MALLFMDGFDHYATAQILLKWTTQITGSNSTITAGSARTGTQGLSMASNHGYRKTVSSGTHDTFIVGVACRRTGASSDGVIQLGADNGATTHITLNINDDGTLDVRRGSSTGTQLGSTVNGATTIGVWHFIELKVTLSDTVGTVEVRVDGISVLSLTGQDTKNAGTATVFDSVTLFGTGTLNFDDFYLLNGSGSSNNNFLGDVRVQTLYPTGAGNTTQLTPSTGSNWQCVDEATPNTSDTVSSATDNQYDTYQTGDVANTTGSIAGIQLAAYVQKSDTGAKSVALMTRTNGTDYTGPDVTLTQSYAYAFQLRETNPNTGAAWTASEINAMEIGAKVRP